MQKHRKSQNTKNCSCRISGYNVGSTDGKDSRLNRKLKKPESSIISIRLESAPRSALGARRRRRRTRKLKNLQFGSLYLLCCTTLLCSKRYTDNRAPVTLPELVIVRSTNFPSREELLLIPVAAFPKASINGFTNKMRCSKLRQWACNTTFFFGKKNDIIIIIKNI